MSFVLQGCLFMLWGAVILAFGVVLGMAVYHAVHRTENKN